MKTGRGWTVVTRQQPLFSRTLSLPLSWCAVCDCLSFFIPPCSVFQLSFSLYNLSWSQSLSQSLLVISLSVGIRRQVVTVVSYCFVLSVTVTVVQSSFCVSLS